MSEELTEQIFYGTVCYYNHNRVYGFIYPKENPPPDGRGIFFHRNDSNLEKGQDFSIGDEVSYKMGVDRNGREKAVEVYRFTNPTTETKETSNEV